MNFQPLGGVTHRCQKCGADAPITEADCPDCGHQIVSSKRLRVAGVLYLVIGLALTGTLLFFAAYVGVILSQSEDPAAKIRFEGTRLEAAGILGFLLMVSMIGVLGIVTGLWQITRGTRNPALVRTAGYLYMLFWLVYGVIWWLN